MPTKTQKKTSYASIFDSKLYIQFRFIPSAGVAFFDRTFSAIHPTETNLIKCVCVGGFIHPSQVPGQAKSNENCNINKKGRNRSKLCFPYQSVFEFEISTLANWHQERREEEKSVMRSPQKALKMKNN